MFRKKAGGVRTLRWKRCPSPTDEGVLKQVVKLSAPEFIAERCRGRTVTTDRDALARPETLPHPPREARPILATVPVQWTTPSLDVLGGLSRRTLLSARNQRAHSLT